MHAWVLFTYIYFFLAKDDVQYKIMDAVLSVFFHAPTLTMFELRRSHQSQDLCEQN